MNNGKSDTYFIYFYPLLISHTECCKFFLDKHSSSVIFQGTLMVYAFKADRYSCSALDMKCLVLCGVLKTQCIAGKWFKDNVPPC